MCSCRLGTGNDLRIYLAEHMIGPGIEEVTVGLPADLVRPHGGGRAGVAHPG
jgi:hypothetical protein